jgi:hypothetical protein
VSSRSRSEGRKEPTIVIGSDGWECSRVEAGQESRYYRMEAAERDTVISHSGE